MTATQQQTTVWPEISAAELPVAEEVVLRPARFETVVQPAPHGEFQQINKYAICTDATVQNARPFYGAELRLHPASSEPAPFSVAPHWSGSAAPEPVEFGRREESVEHDLRRHGALVSHLCRQVAGVQYRGGFVAVTVRRTVGPLTEHSTYLAADVGYTDADEAAAEVLELAAGMVEALRARSAVQSA